MYDRCHHILFLPLIQRPLPPTIPSFQRLLNHLRRIHLRLLRLRHDPDCAFPVNGKRRCPVSPCIGVRCVDDERQAVGRGEEVGDGGRGVVDAAVRGEERS